MKHFVYGFLVATLLWGVTWLAYSNGAFGSEPVAEVPVEEEVTELAAEPTTKKNKRRRAKRRGMKRNTRVGDDDLGENEARQLNAGANGGEAQLTTSQIESVFDQNFSKIRRCLVLVEGEVTGKLVFGLRIDSSGQVTKANLRGPREVTQGESGSCLRSASKKMRFPSFDGPPMVAHYPVTLE